MKLKEMKREFTPIKLELVIESPDELLGLSRLVGQSNESDHPGCHVLHDIIEEIIEREGV